MATAKSGLWAVHEWHNCEDQGDCEGSLVYAVCATKQLAEQALDRKGGTSFGYVSELRVASTLRDATGGL